MTAVTFHQVSMDNYQVRDAGKQFPATTSACKHYLCKQVTHIPLPQALCTGAWKRTNMELKHAHTLLPPPLTIPTSTPLPT